MSSLRPFSVSIPEPDFVGESPAIQVLRATIDQVSRGDAKVLITGESGVGKDVVARLIHAHSLRRERPFVAVNCGAITETLLESELFGHVRGSFTGAYRDKIGKLQLAHTGTIFLDEVGEMSLRMQALLLRFLENGEIQPVGSDRPARTVDVRVIAATNRHLPDLLAAGQFREDLMYRLKVVHLHVPPLRDRCEDVRSLVKYTIERTGRGIQFTEAALSMLERHRWPGNVRELQNLVEQVASMVPGDVVGVDDLPANVRSSNLAAVTPTRERRRQIADELYAGLLAGTCTFWSHVHPLFLNRDITRHDLRQLVRRGLAATGGNYRAVLRQFGMADRDYKRFLNFLAAHDCAVDFRPFRTGQPQSSDPIFNPLAALPPSARAVGQR